MPSSILGKRKARTTTTTTTTISTTAGPHDNSDDDHDDDESAQDAQAIFQRYFEAQFTPLEGAPAAASTAKSRSKSKTAIEDIDMRSDDEEDEEEEGEEEADDNDSWSGVSESDEHDTTAKTNPEIQVVSHVDPSSSSPIDPLSAKRTRKELLSSKVPSAMTDGSTSSQAAASKKSAKATASEEDAPSLLKNDLELQRLLTESHLFNPSKVGTLSNTVTHHHPRAGSTEHVGRNRLLANDLRMAALGSKMSIYAQAKMPISHRKGINAAAVAREDKRRREARENGIILERPSGNTDALKAYTRAAGVVKNKNSRTAAAGKGKRSAGRDIGAPAVGKMRDGMLRLSKKDIRDIQGNGERRGVPGGKGRKGKRR